MSLSATPTFTPATAAGNVSVVADTGGRCQRDVDCVLCRCRRPVGAAGKHRRPARRSRATCRSGTHTRRQSRRRPDARSRSSAPRTAAPTIQCLCLEPSLYWRHPTRPRKSRASTSARPVQTQTDQPGRNQRHHGRSHPRNHGVTPCNSAGNDDKSPRLAPRSTAGTRC